MANEKDRQSTDNNKTLLFTDMDGNEEPSTYQSDSDTAEDKTMVLPDPETGNDMEYDEYVPEYASDVGFDFEEDEDDLSKVAPPPRKPAPKPQREPSGFRAIMDAAPEDSENPPSDPEQEVSEYDIKKTVVTPPPDESAIDTTQIISPEELEDLGIVIGGKESQTSDQTIQEQDEFTTDLEDSVDKTEILGDMNLDLGDESYHDGTAGDEEDYPEQNTGNNLDLPELQIDRELREGKDDFKSPADAMQKTGWDIMGGTYSDNISDDEGFGVESLIPDDDYNQSFFPSEAGGGAELDTDDTDLTDIMKRTVDGEAPQDDIFSNHSMDTEDNLFDMQNISTGSQLGEDDDDFGTLGFSSGDDNDSLFDIGGNFSENDDADFHNAAVNLTPEKDHDFTNKEVNLQDQAEHDFKNTPLNLELPEISLVPSDTGMDDEDEELLEPYALSTDDEEVEAWSDEPAEDIARQESGNEADMSIPELNLGENDLAGAEDDIEDIFGEANQMQDMHAENILSSDNDLSDEISVNETPAAEDMLSGQDALSFEGFDLSEPEETLSEEIPDESMNLDSVGSDDDMSAFMSQSDGKIVDDMLDSSEHVVETPAADLSEEMFQDDLLMRQAEMNKSGVLPDMELGDMNAKDSVDLPAVDLADDMADMGDNLDEDNSPLDDALLPGEAPEADSDVNLPGIDISGDDSEEQSLDTLLPEATNEAEAAAENPQQSQDWSDAIEPVPIAMDVDSADDDDPSKILYMGSDGGKISLTVPITEEESSFKKTKFYKTLVNLKKVGMLIGKRVDKIIYWSQNWRIYLSIISAIIVTICSAIWIGSYVDS